MSGDEKHDPSALSTLDVLWVLYDRVLDRTRATGSCSPRVTARWPTTRCSRPRATSPSRVAGRLRRVRLAARPPPRPRARPGRRDLERLARPRPADRRRRVALARPARLLPGRRRRARRGQQLGGDPVRRPRRARPADGGGGRQLDPPPTVGPAAIEARFALEGWTAERVDGRDHDALERAFRAGGAGRPHAVVAEVRR